MITRCEHETEGLIEALRRLRECDLCGQRVPDGEGFESADGVFVAHDACQRDFLRACAADADPDIAADAAASLAEHWPAET